jgi:aminopeptidase
VSDAEAARRAQLQALAGLIVADVGVNVQPGQVVGITTEPGQEEIWRAVAEAAYERGATFVDPWIFDGHVKHSRLTHAPLESLAYRPPWWAARLQALGDMGGAQIRLTGPVAPTLMDDIPAERLGHDMMPRLPETLGITHARKWNWIVAPGPSAGWASALYPELKPTAAVDRMWEEIAFCMRLNEPDPAAAWRTRFTRLDAVAAWVNARRFDSLHFEGPGTDLSVGLLAGSIFKSAGGDVTAGGIPFTPNLPSEEIFSAPDPQRVDGYVAATKPLVVGGGTVRGLTVRFVGGRAVEVDAEVGAGLVQTMVAKDDGAARLGEVALVDGDSRIGQLGTVFYETLFDENSASHVALGAAYPDTVADDASRAQINSSSIHIDFMIGSNDVAVTGVTRDGTRVPLLRDGVWQLDV